MKVRCGYVSNSSSSSFVLHTRDDAKVESLLDEYIAGIDFSSYDYLDVAPNDVKALILDKLHKPADKDLQEALEIYVTGALQSIFEAMLHYFVYLRNWELSECIHCDKYKTHFKKGTDACCRCWYRHYWKSAEDCRRAVEDGCADFPEFKFKKEFKEIKDFVYALPLVARKIGDELELVVPFDDLGQLDIDSYVRKYYELWRTAHPDAFVLSFASDDGDDVEALVRYDIINFVLFMQEHGITGFRGENS